MDRLSQRLLRGFLHRFVGEEVSAESKLAMRMTSNQNSLLMRTVLNIIATMGFLSSIISAFAQDETYKDPAFTFSHPAGWTKLSSSTPDSLSFSDPTGSLHLTVSVMNYNTSVTGQALRDAFERVIQHRMDAEKKFMAASDPLEHSSTEAIPDGYQSHFHGYESAKNRRFTGLLLMAKGTMLCFYIEGTNKTEAELKAVSDVIFSKVKLR
ncbi:MAG TPA: hypothetical protein VG733_16870 [Chthoniobacteraceae bacterium]|nr:hypothetical protein [Chthoniobacteraceae bacterium]